MRRRFGVVYHLWNASSATDELLDRLIGEVGAEMLVVPVVGGPRVQFRPQAAGEQPHLMVTEGGWHYPPQAEAYRTTAVRPRTARWMGKRDVLARVAELARKRDIELLLGVDLRGCALLADHHPHLRCRNAWGESEPGSGLCVLNPELRELATDVLRDLRRYGPAGFELANWLPDVPALPAPRPLEHTPTARGLLDVCFCPACRQVAVSAEIDPDAAARSVRLRMEQALGSPVADAAADPLADDEVLAGYVAARRQAAAAWYRQALRGGDGRDYLTVRHPPTGALGWHQPSLTPLLEAAGCVLVSGPEAATRPTIADIRPAGCVLEVWRPAVQTAEELVKQVVAAAEVGGDPIILTGIDEAPAEVVDWLRKAVRFARRV